MADDESTGLVLKLIICLIAAASAAVFVTIYHCITAGNIHAIMRLHRNPTPQTTFVSTAAESDPQLSIETSVAELLPTHKFQKDMGLIGVDDNMCAVCLSEFEHDEELRTLPECMHSFHVQCIDMWLNSHSNCPMCRTIVVPSPLMLSQLLDSNSGSGKRTG
ncbi:RING-H2 finger protein ATL52 [Forsythia ovata]|uniref:RING-type E3 ubiquitin transferase n=1 Tax=Forsythia ovata TaxID=205694 RepID=A0ABD1WHP2_9LAMI